MFSEKQLDILAFPYSRYDALICSGAIRSGKTSIMSFTFVDWAMDNFNGYRFGICGKTVKSAIENIISPLMAMTYIKKKYRVKFNRQANLMTVTRGRVTNTFEVFGGKDESSYQLIQGRTLAGVLLDEVVLMPRSFVNQATARCSVDGSLLWFNCNPDSPHHWFYLEWILNARDMNALVLEFQLEDNPSLSERKISQYKSRYHGVFYQRYVLGKWVIAEGLIYQFEDEGEYRCPDETARGLFKNRDGEEVEGGGSWYLSIDYGITNPFAALLWRVYDGMAYLCDEYYFASREQGRRKTDSEHADSLESFIGNRRIEYVVIDPSANSFKEELWRRGKWSVIDADNSVLDGIQVVDQMLHDGSIKISDKCKNTIKELGLYRWDDSSTKTQPIKEDDHAMDAMRYLANTILKYELKGYS